jgi:hypothetical protein
MGTVISAIGFYDGTSYPDDFKGALVFGDVASALHLVDAAY